MSINTAHSYLQDHHDKMVEHIARLTGASIEEV
jgi:hypothetical protein